MEISITIQEEKVYSEVYAITAHTGKALEKMDKVSATEDESSVLTPFLNESTAELSDVIASFGTISYGAGTIDLSFSLPSNWKESVKPTLEQCLINYLTNSVCQRWFAMTNRDDVKYYADKVVVNAANIIKLLCERKRPER